jgi:hypothetical protein
MEAENELDGIEEVDAVPVLAARRKGGQLAPVLATRSFLIDVHLLGSRD